VGQGIRKAHRFHYHFLFVIDSQNRTSYGDGLAFFLAPPNGSTIPDVSLGGAMGLTKYNETFNSTHNALVVVEFDIFSNTGDPPGVHVGIDINSKLSVANVPWFKDSISIEDWKINEARINYNSSSHNLSILFTGLINNAVSFL
jgi:hypothetical protein